MASLIIELKSSFFISFKSIILLVRIDKEFSLNSIIPLKNEGAIRLTISKYYLPSGKSISEIGVAPDISIEEEENDFRIDTETDNQLNFARKLLAG